MTNGEEVKAGEGEGSDLSTFRLADQKELEFVVVAKDGMEYKFEPFVLARKFEPLTNRGLKIDQQMTVLHDALKIPGITDGEAFMILSAFHKYMDSLDAVKKVSDP